MAYAVLIYGYKTETDICFRVQIGYKAENKTV